MLVRQYQEKKRSIKKLDKDMYHVGLGRNQCLRFWKPDVKRWTIKAYSKNKDIPNKNFDHSWEKEISESKVEWLLPRRDYCLHSVAPTRSPIYEALISCFKLLWIQTRIIPMPNTVIWSLKVNKCTYMCDTNKGEQKRLRRRKRTHLKR